MALLNNSPTAQTLLRLEARKSFAFSVRLKDSNDNALDATGCSFVIVAKPYPLSDSDSADDLNFIVNDTADVTEAAAGVAKFELQASDLDQAVGEYPFVVVMTTATGYSVVLIKGVIDLQENTEHVSIGSTYADADPGLALDVTLRDTVVLEVVVGGILPPNTQFFTDADKAKLDAITITSGGLEVDLSGYATEAYADAQAAAAQAAAQAYGDATFATIGHTHTVTALDGISSGTAAPSGGSDGDLYLRYIP